GNAMEAKVDRARFMGGRSLLELRVGPEDDLFRAAMPGVFMPEPGTQFWITLPRARCFVFPAG
ncbi:MAG: TOBE domain-containing protein, partial [Pseudomonadota bacterium]